MNAPSLNSTKLALRHAVFCCHRATSGILAPETIWEHLPHGEACQDYQDHQGSRSTTCQPRRSPKRRPPASAAKRSYTAADIEVLEGLEPVRRRPGMYIGGTDEKALHHLFAEVIDNSMDEAVAGHASWIDGRLWQADGYLTVIDNGRGMPVDPHPKFKDKSALEVIMTMLHAGGKFDSSVYETSGGLHGVGVSVVNALSEHVIVEVARGQQLYRQEFKRGKPAGKLQNLGKVRQPPRHLGALQARRADFRQGQHRLQRRPPLSACRAPRPISSAASKSAGLRSLPHQGQGHAGEGRLHFPGGLKDFLEERLDGHTRVADEIFSGKVEKPGGHGTVEWAVAWFAGDDGFVVLLLQHHPDPRRRHP